MKKVTLSALIVLFLSAHSSYVTGQDAKPLASANADNVLTKVEQNPQFIGGEKKLFEFISANLKYPQAAKAKGISGKVYVKFIVDQSGKVRDAKILKGIGTGCDEEVLRVVSIMPPWIPGKDGGQPVSVYFTLPVNFSL